MGDEGLLHLGRLVDGVAEARWPAHDLRPDAFRVLREHVRLERIAYLQRLLRHIDGERPEPYVSPTRAEPMPPQGPAPLPLPLRAAPDAGPTLAPLVAAFLADPRERDVSPKTVAHRERVLGWLVAHLGADRPVTEVRRVEVRAFLDRVQAGDFDGLDRRRAPGGTAPRKAAKTVNTCRSAVSRLFTWAIDHDHLLANPCQGLTLRRRDEGDARRPFEVEERDRIFRTGPFQTGPKARPSRHWVPLLALFTGARLNELCQLRVGDVVERQGILALHVRPDAASDRRVRTSLIRFMQAKRRRDEICISRLSAHS